MKKEIIYNKLVRDFIPSIIEKENKIANTHIADDKEFREKLIEKLIEEINEFKESKSIEEIADIYEVLEAISKNFNFPKNEILKLKEKKAKIRGRFDKKIILDSIKD